MDWRTVPRVALAWCVGCLAGSAMADDWKPAAGPLTTRWAKDVSPANALPEYPRPQMVRKDWVNLNGLWQYAITAKDAPRPTNWDGQILVPYPVESALSGVMKPVSAGQRLWYRRSFERPSAPAGGRVLLHFGAVDWQASVSVNGKVVGQHAGGFDPFTFDVTDALKDGENEIVVSVWDPSEKGPQPRGKQEFNAIAKPGGIMYTPCTGIWQTVWLEPVPKSYIRSLKITPDLDKGEVEVVVDLVGGSDKPDGDVLTFAVSDGGAEVRTNVGPGPSGIVRLKIADAKLWSVESPHLYDLVVKANGDEVRSYFGMRKIEVRKDEKGTPRLFLNNQPVFMAGPLDQGYWPDGIYTAPTDAALKYDIEVTKQLGFNATRKHVKVEPARWYYWCDKLGLLVWQDMPSGDKSMGPGRGELKRTEESAAIYRAELKAMIDARRNHPSIVMWVVFNEGWGQFDTVNVAKWTKQYDPSRLVNPASGWNDYPAGDVEDMHNYPGPGAPKPKDGRAAVLGEFGGLGLPTEGHMWTTKNWGYRGVADPQALTRQYGKLLARSYALRDSAGLSALIYTQLTDVETEANGLLTYDRAVIKVDVAKTADANRGKLAPPPVMVPILATSQEKGAVWRYRTEAPADDWLAPGSDDATWKTGEAGFGTRGTPGAVVRTEWKTDDIWIRRQFTLDALPKAPMLMLHHDEDAEVYVNGVLAAKVTGFIGDYEETDLTAKGKAALKVGANTIAVHCHQTRGGQYIDVGIVDAK